MILKAHTLYKRKALADTGVLQIALVDQGELRKASIVGLSNLKMFRLLQSGLEKATSPKRTNPHRRPRKTNKPSYAAFAATW